MASQVLGRLLLPATRPLFRYASSKHFQTYNKIDAARTFTHAYCVGCHDHRKVDFLCINGKRNLLQLNLSTKYRHSHHDFHDHSSLNTKRSGGKEPSRQSYDSVKELALGARGFKRQAEIEERGDIVDESAGRLLEQLKEHDHMMDENAGWLIRLSNENGYLSWCRNVYILTIASVTMYTQDLLVPYSKEAAIVLLLMGGMKMTLGTSVFVYNIVHLREKMMMRRITTMSYISAAITHAILWFGAIAIYLGYVEEEGDDDDPENEKGKNIVRHV